MDDDTRKRVLIGSGIGLAGLAVAAGTYYWLRKQRQHGK